MSPWPAAAVGRPSGMEPTANDVSPPPTVPATAPGRSDAAAPLDLSAVRTLAWIALLALAVLQAWAGRFTLSPDGMSYLDLSDAVVADKWGGLVNAYWSPLYPALIGVLRAVLRSSAYWEFAVVHLLNLLLFAASIAAFEYFLDPLARLAATWGRPELDRPGGRAAAYAFFGIFSLTMTPLTLPTPDLAVSTAVYVVLGALLRVQSSLCTRYTAPTLGLALAFGALAKSFLIPWSVVCLAVLWWATRRTRGLRPTIAAKGPWVALVLPWCVILSLQVGHPTFGETGRLTYVWAMDFDASPSDQAMPPAASTPAADSLLRGLAIMPKAEGTDPIWLDPARWYGGLRIHWNVERTVATFARYLDEYVTAFAPLVVLLWLALLAADAEARRVAWRRGWVVAVPVLVALTAYAMVLVTTRYIAPFVIAGTLVMWLALPWPERLPPWRVAIALGLGCLAIDAAPNAQPVLASQASLFAGVLMAWVLHRGSRGRMLLIAVIAAVAMRWLLQVVPEMTTLFVFTWAAAVASVAAGSIKRDVAPEYSRFLRTALAVTSAIVLGLAAGAKYLSSVNGVSVASQFGVANLPDAIADDLRSRGIGPGTPVAIVGSPFDAYWARSARVHFVGIVPEPLVQVFWTMPQAKRDAVIAEFAKAGARAVVVTAGPVDLAKTDSSWVPTRYLGWVKSLTVSKR